MENTIISERIGFDNYIIKLIKFTNKHMKKYSHKAMSVEELDNLCKV